LTDKPKDVNVAVIGAGYWGKNLVRNYHALKSLHTICDTNPEALDKFSRAYPGVETTSGPEEVFADENVNAIVISTPASTHYDMVLSGLEAGKHVFVEKPLCMDVAKGEELVKLAGSKGLALMVGHLLHYHPAIIELKKLIDQGELGRLQYIYSNRLNLGKIRTEENILWSFAPHDISLILSLARQMPERVISAGSHFLNDQVADVTLSHLMFPSGINAHIFVSWLHPFKEQKLVVVGDRNMAVFDDTHPDRKLLLYPHEINWINGAPVPAKKEAAVVEIGDEEPLYNECENFIDAVAEGKRPYTDGAEGLKTLTVLSACQESLKHGGREVDIKHGSTISVGDTGYRAHSTAVVDDGLHIGEGTVIWHFSHIMTGSRIGPNCNIGQNVVIGPNVSIGSGCKIQNNVCVYEGVTLEDDVFCGPSMVFTNVFNPRSHIGRMSEIKPTLVRKGATIGANATIMCGVTLGKFSFVGAGAVVLGDVPDFALVAGNPAICKGWMCRCGAKLEFNGNDKTVCGECGAGYGFENDMVTED